MVSEPNFVLGIKQKSLASKEDSHVHITVRSHRCLFAGSRIHSISQPRWLTVVSRSSNQVSCDLTYQIYAKPSKPWLSLSNLCTTNLRLMKPTRQTCSTAYRDQNLGTRPPTAAACAENGSWNSHTRRRRFSTPNLDLSHTRRQDGLVVHRFTWPENLVVIRRCTRHHTPPRFLAFPPRAGEHCMLLPCTEICCWCHLTLPDDVITPHQQPCKHIHISPSPCQRHIIGWRQRLYCSTHDLTRKPGINPN